MSGNTDNLTAALTVSRSSALSLSTLPVELLREIIPQLDRQTTRSLRSTNRAVSAVASEFLFRDITIPFTARGLRGLSNIAACDSWRHQVRNITWKFHDDLNSDVPFIMRQYADYNGRPWQDVGGTCCKCRPDGLREECKAYCWLNEQLRLLEQMPNIETICGRCVVNASGEDPKPLAWSFAEGLPRCHVLKAFLKFQAKVIWVGRTRFKLWYDPQGEPRDIKARHELPFLFQFNLRRLECSKMRFEEDDLNYVLVRNQRLERLTLVDVELESSLFWLGRRAEDAVDRVLSHWRDEIRKFPGRNLRLGMRNMSLRGFEGRFDASEEEIDAWTKGLDDGLLDRIKSKLNRKTPEQILAHTRDPVFNVGNDLHSLDYASEGDEDFDK